MRQMGLQVIWQKPNTSKPNPEHKVYPYLLRGLAIDRPNQVWATDITYIPMPKGFFYLVAIMDWHSRKVLTWRLSNTMDATFCVEALEEALALYGRPEIFNSDQGAQFTSTAFTGVLAAAGVRISMDGKGRCMDNVFVEAHPGFRGAGSGVRRPGRRPTRRGEPCLFCARYGRTERTQDRGGASPARCRDEAAARSAAVTSILPWC